MELNSGKQNEAEPLIVNGLITQFMEHNAESKLIIWEKLCNLTKT